MRLTHPQQLIYDMEKFAGGSISVICGSMISEGEREIADLINAVRKVYEINDALRIHICEVNGEVSQEVTEYVDRAIEVLRFGSKQELDTYAQGYAQVPLDLYGNLCELKVVLLPGYYGFLAKTHHIISDAWTLSMIGTQLNTILHGDTPAVYSYCEYAANESEYLQSKRYENDRIFFLDQYKKCDEVTYLSEKHSSSLTAVRKTFVMDFDQAQRIKEYAAQSKSSPYALFMTVLAVYINRVKMNTENFYIGTAVINRGGMREKNTMGMFVNTVPLLMELENEKSFSDNLSKVSKTVFNAFRHQKFNYGEVLASLRSEYGFGEKLYDVMLSYQNAAIAGAPEDMETTWYHSGMQSESLQIHIDDRDSDGIFRIHYDYLIDRFTEHEIEMLHKHLETLLFDAIANDAKRIYELDILTAEEKQKLKHAFNDTAVEYPKDKCIHQLFEEQVAKTPDKVALIARDKTLTYAELNEQANQIAHSLIARGVHAGDIVAFALSRRSHLISSILGILKSGAVYLPVDPDYPQDRIDYILKDSNAALFITENEIEDYLNKGQTGNPSVAMTSEDLCYCIYTSGSTGNPKGALIRHRNMVNFCNNTLANNLQYYIAQNCSAVLACGSITFDISNFEILLSLLLGKTVVLADEKEVSNANLLAKLIQTNRIDCIHCTPTKLHAYLDNAEFASAFSDIKCLMVGGEQLTEDICEVIHKNSSAAVFNGYGPTETTMGVSFGETNSADITIGKPIANTQIYIVDKNMYPVPIGVTGGLCIAGDGVGAGYLNRPELTAEKFVDNPFGKGKLYKTGDLAYWREDGNIAFVGRNDFQVKIRGLRIELGEIENAICGIYGISQAVVVVRKNSEGRQLICAFYTGEEVDAKEIRSHIGKKLPKYMLPHICTHLDTMPLTTSGKVNRKALPEVDLYSIDTSVEYIAPVSEQEKALATAIGVILGIEKVSLLDNFFDLGGDSLKAIELISKLDTLGYHTEVKTIFDCDTVRELAEKLTATDETAAEFTYDGDIPATDAQMRIYTAQEMYHDSTVYNVPYAFRVSDLDVSKLQFAVDAMVERHEILRTSFENKDGNIIQVINPTAECVVEKLESDDIGTFMRPFDLSKAPLLRVGYYGNTVMIDMHHIITDGGSMPVFLYELNELYMGRTLRNATVPYKQFAVQKTEQTESENYWLSVFGDEVPVLEINTDHKRGQKQSINGKAIYDSIDISLHKQILAECKKLNITPYAFYMGAFNILLSKFSGSEDIVVGMPISGRESKYLNTIGMFVNTIALRNQPVGTKTVQAFLGEVKENSVNAIAYQDYPYGELVKKLNINTPGRNPLFDVMFAYQSEQMTDVVFGDEKAELLPVPITTSKYDFTFNIMPRENDVVLMVEYCTDLFMELTIHRFAESYKHILQQMFESE